MSATAHLRTREDNGLVERYFRFSENRHINTLGWVLTTLFLLRYAYLRWK